MPQHELILVLDAGVDEIAEKPAFNPVVRLLRIVIWPIWHTTTDDPVSIVAATGLVLAGDGLASGIDAAHVRAHRTAQPLWIASLDLNPSPDAVLSLTVNVSDSAAVSVAFAEIATKLGPVDVLVNGAGQAGPLTPAAQMKDEDWD